MKLETYGAAHWQAAVLLLLLSAGGASAKDCLQSKPAGVAMVTGHGRAYFHDDASICPNRQTYCLKRAYVIAGNQAPVSRELAPGRFSAFEDKIGG